MDYSKQVNSNKFNNIRQSQLSIQRQKIYLTMKLQSANELNEQVLERSLVELPRLINLHIINCQNLSLPGVLKCLVYTPLLESLSVTTFMHVCGFTLGYHCQL